MTITRVTYTASVASAALAAALFTGNACADDGSNGASMRTIDVIGSSASATRDASSAAAASAATSSAATSSAATSSSAAAASTKGTAPTPLRDGPDLNRQAGVAARSPAAPRLRIVVPTAYAYAVRDIARTFTAHTGMPVTVHVTTAGNAPGSVREGLSEPLEAEHAAHAQDPAMPSRPADHRPTTDDTPALAATHPRRHGSPQPHVHAFDIVIATEADIRQMSNQGLITPHSTTALPKVGIGLAVPKGQALPDIRSIAALRRTLLAARTVAFEDPALGGPSGANVVKLFDRLGVADRMKSRSKMVPADDIPHALTHAHADLVIEEAPLLRDAPGVQYVGDLPVGVQYFTRYTGAVTARSTHPTESRALLSFIAAGLSPQLQRDP